ncbi:MAG TPA: RNA-binding S4 domain-containing protein [Clostridiales bacterium]|nr:RNA-binding S4 domain-containing protein [Clostridiales bacterium]
MKTERVKIKGEYIKLDSLLKLTAAVSTGGQAKLEIQSGNVKVNGEVCTMRGKKLYPGDSVEYKDARFVIE